MSALGLAALVLGGVFIRAAILGVSPMAVIEDLLFKAQLPGFTGFSGGSFGSGTGGGSTWGNPPGRGGGGGSKLV